MRKESDNYNWLRGKYYLHKPWQSKAFRPCEDNTVSMFECLRKFKTETPTDEISW